MPRFESIVAVSRLNRGQFRQLLCATLLVATFTVSCTSAFGQFVGPTALALQNGWKSGKFQTGHPLAEMVQYTVQLRGEINDGTGNPVFTLGPALVPSHVVYVPVNLCNAANGRLIIEPSGEVSVQAESTFSDAQCQTSLEGVSFINANPNVITLTPLNLINGWTPTVFGTADPSVTILNGVVHFIGAMSTTGANPQPFVLPVAYRPTTNVFINVDLCDGTKGQLKITPSGIVTVQAETSFSNAQCFTSLDGAWFVKNSTGFRLLTLQNGWTNSPLSTSKVEAGNIYGLVYFKGAIATGGTNPQPFSLPAALAPVTNVSIPIDLCNGAKGALYIRPQGEAMINTENSFSDAQCLTSLDGVSFVQ